MSEGERGEKLRGGRGINGRKGRERSEVERKGGWVEKIVCRRGKEKG